MAIKIPIKPKLSSNKSQTTVQMDDKSVPKPPEQGASPNSLIPFIDKISVVLTVPETQDADDIYVSLISSKIDTEVLKSASSSGGGGHKRRAWRVVIPSVVHQKKWPHLQLEFDPALKLARKLRIEFSPVDLGAEGMQELRLNLISLMPEGWGYFQKHGRVTMLEVTLDVPGVGMEDFHVLPGQATTSATYKRNGKLETLYLGKKRGRQLKVYDRGEKRLAKGQKWAGPPTTRIERSVRPAKALPLSELGNLPNPFADLQIVDVTPGCPPEEEQSNKAYLWWLFLDSARVRNLNASLKLLPPKKQAAYRKWLAKHTKSWWQPAAIWADWPKVVADSALLPGKPG